LVAGFSSILGLYDSYTVEKKVVGVFVLLRRFA
jgi:hypothetical protein